MKIIKNLLTAIMLFTMLVTCSPLCFANNTIYSSGNMPAQIKSNSTFKVDLMCECTEILGTTTFVISYGGNVTYNSCKVSDSDNGYIVDLENNGVINITYLNTLGIDISNNKKLAEITMKSGEVGSGWVDIKTIYSASSNEKNITDSNSSIHYEIDVVEKVTNKSNASGTSIKSKASSKNSSSKSSSTKKSISQSSVGDDVADDKDSTDEKTDGVDMIDLSEKPNNIIVFVAGGIFAVSIVIVIIVSYNMGKKRSEKQDKSE